MENETVVALVDGKFVDQNGDAVDLPYHNRRKLREEGGCLRSRGSRWRWAKLTVYDELRAKAQPLEVLENVTDEKQGDIEKFIGNATSLRPANLIISDLKWKYLIRSVIRGKNIMMTGPSGCGKTLAVQSISEALNDRPYYYFNLGATTDPRSALIGNTHYAPEQGTFVADALFVTAIQQEDAIILLDEVTRATPDAWNILMSVLDQNQRYLRIDEKPDTPTIKVAKGVTFIATANVGAEYTATRVLDRALQERFTAIVEMEALTYEDEEKLLAMTYPQLDRQVITAIAEIADETRRQVKSEDPRVTSSISSRLTVEMAGIIQDGFTLEEAAEVCIFPFFSDAGGVDSERTFMRQLVQKYAVVEHDAATPWDADQANRADEVEDILSAAGFTASP